MDTNVALTIGPPGEIVESARVGAKALTDIINQKPKKVIINGEQYIEFEDWQLVGQFFGVSVRTLDPEPVTIGGIDGARAEALLIHMESGLEIGGASAYCMKDEEKWMNKPWYQLASMAQTRAGAKALRNRFSWVVVLAGYKTTPAEEMDGVGDTAPRSKAEHWCSEHQTLFFKKGRMKNFAHKIEGTDNWCNEEEQKAAPAATEASSTAPATSASSSIHVDMATLFDNLKAGNWADALGYLKEKYGATGKYVSEIIPLLSKEQQEEFYKEAEDRRAEAERDV